MNCSLSLLTWINFSCYAFAPTGNMKGTLRDVKTQEPITGATVVLSGTPYEAANNFQITKVPVGTQSQPISYDSYKPNHIDSLSIQAGKTTLVNTALEAKMTLLGEKAITGTKHTNNKPGF